MSKKTVLILTRTKDLSDYTRKVRVCSPNNMAPILQSIYGDAPQAHRDIASWLSSAFAVRQAPARHALAVEMARPADNSESTEQEENT